ncbi:DUF2127 domain-containing protein [Patescibacteria group bacterium]|nr:DUF2127 domain-containing protein [Patescibacteria group bacterium]
METPSKVAVEGVTERERDLLWIFDLALWFKIVNGALEMLVALLILFVPASLVLQLAQFATSGEIAQDSNDYVAFSILSMAQIYAVHTHYLTALYLALHGGVKVILVIGIFMKKKIAYPLFMFALVLFGVYEAFRGFVLHEILLQVLAVLDFALLILTVHEYRRRYPGPFRFRR